MDVLVVGVGGMGVLLALHEQHLVPGQPLDGSDEVRLQGHALCLLLLFYVLDEVLSLLIFHHFCQNPLTGLCVVAVVLVQLEEVRELSHGLPHQSFLEVPSQVNLFQLLKQLLAHVSQDFNVGKDLFNLIIGGQLLVLAVLLPPTKDDEAVLVVFFCSDLESRAYHLVDDSDLGSVVASELNEHVHELPHKSVDVEAAQYSEFVQQS